MNLGLSIRLTKITRIPEACTDWCKFLQQMDSI